MMIQFICQWITVVYMVLVFCVSVTKDMKTAEKEGAASGLLSLVIGLVVYGCITATLYGAGAFSVLWGTQ
jgi:hypothetical protein